LELLRLSVAEFFYTQSVSLVGEDDDIVLDAYRLARWYRQSPEIFLAMPLSEVRAHIARTEQLSRIMRSLTKAEDD
jgi:hypothetical protein